MDAKLVLFLLSLLKQDNYRELVDSTSFLKLLGLKGDEPIQQVEATYKLLKDKLHPEYYPGNSVYKERFEYLIYRLDRGYNEYISTKPSLEESIETPGDIPISPMELGNNLRQDVLKGEAEDKKNYRFISEGPEEFQAPPYVSYREANKVKPFDFISQGRSQPQPPPYVSYSEAQEQKKHRLISEGPEEFEVPPYIPYRKEFHHDFISEGPSDGIREKSEINVTEVYGVDDVFKAAEDMKKKYLTIPTEQIDGLAARILGVVIRDVKQDISASEMVERVSEVLRNYLIISLDEMVNLSVQILGIVIEDISKGSSAPEMVERVSEVLRNYSTQKNYPHNK